MSKSELKLIKHMLDEFFSRRHTGDAHEALGLDPEHPDVQSADWLDDVAQILAKRLKEEPDDKRAIIPDNPDRPDPEIEKRLESFLNFDDGVWETIYGAVDRFCEREGINKITMEFVINIEKTFFDTTEEN